MYRHKVCLAIYLTVLSSICLNDYIKKRTLYECLIGMVEKQVQHILLSLFFVGAMYVIGKALVLALIGTLSPLEKEGIQDSSIRYLGNICLFVTMFADNITIRVIVLFAFVFGIKVFHWIAGLRIDALEKSGASCTEMKNVIILSVFLFLIDGFLAYQFIQAAIISPGISIMFAFEFFTLFSYAIRSIYVLMVLYWDVSVGLEDKIFLVFFGDFMFCTVKILGTFLCLLWTMLHFKVPINLLRDCILDIKTLVVKTKSILAYKSIIAFLSNCPDILEKDLGSDKTCLICHEDMEVGKKLQCSHIFHFGCLKEWLYRQQACPVCRKEVTSKKKATRPVDTGTGTGTKEEDKKEAKAPGSARNVSSTIKVLLNEEEGDEYEGVLVTLADDP